MIDVDETKYSRNEHPDGRIEFVPIKAKVLGLWKPKITEKYWYVEPRGTVEWNSQMYDMYDLNFAEYGNMFPTEEAAEKAAALMARSNNIIAACLQVDPDFEPDWNNNPPDKYYPIYDHERHNWSCRICFAWGAAPAYVSTLEKCKEVCAILQAGGVK